MHPYYSICRSYMGKPVLLSTRDGRQYQGKITRVTQQEVYLAQLAQQVHGKQKGKVGATTAAGSREKVKGEEILWGAPFAIPLAAIVGLTIVGTAPFWGRPYGGFYGPGYGAGFGYGPGFGRPGFWW